MTTAAAGAVVLNPSEATTLTAAPDTVVPEIGTAVTVDWFAEAIEVNATPGIVVLFGAVCVVGALGLPAGSATVAVAEIVPSSSDEAFTAVDQLPAPSAVGDATTELSALSVTVR